MTRTYKVLLVIAIVISAVEVCAVVVELLTGDESAASLRMVEAGIRWRVYSIGAVAALLLGFVLRQRQALAGEGLVIAGVYLLLLANNGGLFGHGYEPYRLTTSVLTLAFLLLLAVRSDRSPRRNADA